MIELTQASLVALARHYYPTGSPVTTDEYDSEGLLPYQRTPEHARWLEAWDKAMAWPEWKTVVVEKLREEEHLFLQVPDEVQPQAATLSALAERVLGYQAFPLQSGRAV